MQTQRQHKLRLGGGVTVPARRIGYDFFANFTLLVDRLGGEMTIFKN